MEYGNVVLGLVYAGLMIGSGIAVGLILAGIRHKKDRQTNLRFYEDTAKAKDADKEKLKADIERWKAECEDRSTRLKICQATSETAELEISNLNKKLEQMAGIQFDYDGLKEELKKSEEENSILRSDRETTKESFKASLEALKLIKGLTRRDNQIKKIVDAALAKLNAV